MGDDITKKWFISTQPPLSTENHDNGVSTNTSSLQQNNSTENYNNIITPTSLVVLTFALCAIAINLLVLVASKFTTGGRNSILVFIRSLCFADTLIGVYGVSKYVFVSHRPQWVNCFLPDALLICAFIAGNFTLIGLVADCCTNLRYYINKQGRRHLSKYKTIFLMVYVWNSAFILAFLPQMGWNYTAYTCAFFQYHSDYYLAFISLIFFISVILMGVYCVKGYCLLKKLKKDHNHSPHIQLELTKIESLVLTSRYDVIAQVVAFFPFIIYILIHCNSCIKSSADYADAYLLVFIPIILLKSICVGISHGKRTSQISRVFLRNATLVMSVFNKNLKSEASQDIYRIETQSENEQSSSDHSSDHGDNLLRNSMYQFSLGRPAYLKHNSTIKARHLRAERRRANSLSAIAGGLSSITSGLLNVASLAAAATAVPVKISDQQRYQHQGCITCSRCGHHNHALQSRSIMQKPRRATIGQLPNHQLSLLDREKLEQTRPGGLGVRQRSSLTTSSYAYDNETFVNDEKTDVSNDNKKLKWDSLSDEGVSLNSPSIHDTSVIYYKNRANSLDSAISFISSDVSAKRQNSFLNKGTYLQKVVKFKDDGVRPISNANIKPKNHLSKLTTPSTTHDVSPRIEWNSHSVTSLKSLRKESLNQIDSLGNKYIEHDPECPVHGILKNKTMNVGSSDSKYSENNVIRQTYRL